MKKKGDLLGMVITFIIIMFVVLITFNITNRFIVDGTGDETKGILNDVRDLDSDGIPNYFDKCDCEYGEQDDEGCPSGFTKEGTDAEAREKKCHDDNKDKQLI